MYTCYILLQRRCYNNEPGLIMTKIKAIDVLPFAKFQGLLFIPLGFITGFLYSFGGLFSDLLTTGLNWGTALAFLALPGIPIVFAIGGFILGLIEAALYNLLAKKFGGVNIDFVS